MTYVLNCDGECYSRINAHRHACTGVEMPSQRCAHPECSDWCDEDSKPVDADDELGPRICSGCLARQSE